MRRRQKGFGCLEAAGVGCLVLIVLGLIAGVVVYFKWESWVRSIAAGAGEIAADSMMDNLGIPADEKEAAMKPVREFAQRIRDGEVGLEQVGAIAEALAEGPALAAIMARGFEVKYLGPSDLPEEEKKAGHISISRFVQGVSTGKIPKEKAEQIGDICTVETVDDDGDQTRKLKDSITTEELKSCLGIMKDAADAAGIEDKEFKVDLAAEIRKAIETGMAKKPGGGTSK
ncbi:MAG: hypothetical protein ACYSU0_01400 [Planctomycetota bacterium]|jgi:hypothetical protein